MKTADRVLLDAKGLVLGGWSQRHLALNARGVAVPLAHDTAVSYCARGAILRAAFDLGLTGSEVEAHALLLAGGRARKELERDGRRSTVPLSDWNDVIGRKQADVAELLGAAAAEAVWGSQVVLAAHAAEAARSSAPICSTQ
jgi:hypothetical protein